MINPHKSWGKLVRAREAKADKIARRASRMTQRRTPAADYIKGRALRRRAVFSGTGITAKGGTHTEGPVGRLPNLSATDQARLAAQHAQDRYVRAIQSKGYDSKEARQAEKAWQKASQRIYRTAKRNPLFFTEATKRAAKQVKRIARPGARRVIERDTNEGGEIVGVQPGGFVKVKWDNRERPTLIKRSEIKRYPYVRNPHGIESSRTRFSRSVSKTPAEAREIIAEAKDYLMRTYDHTETENKAFHFLVSAYEDAGFSHVRAIDAATRELNKKRKAKFKNPGIMELAGGLQALDYLGGKARKLARSNPRRRAIVKHEAGARKEIAKLMREARKAAKDNKWAIVRFNLNRLYKIAHHQDVAVPKSAFALYDRAFISRDDIIKNPSVYAAKAQKLARSNPKRSKETIWRHTAKAVPGGAREEKTRLGKHYFDAGKRIAREGNFLSAKSAFRILFAQTPWRIDKRVGFTRNDAEKAFSAGYRKRNPSVHVMSQRFQGQANGKVEEYYASDYAPRLDFSRGGKLVFLKLAGTTVRVPGAVVAIDPKTERLWVAGSKATGLFKRKAARKGELLDYGPIDAICYLTRKKHIGSNAAFEYLHKFGEDGGRKPSLMIDHDGMPILKGGDYKIRKEGIVN